MKKLIIILLLIIGWFYWFQWRPEIKIEKCIEEAEKRYYKRWNSGCEIDSEQREDCGLPKEKAKFYENSFNEDRDACFKQYEL